MELAGSTKQIQVLLIRTFWIFFLFLNIFNSWLWFVESLGAGQVDTEGQLYTEAA